MATPAAKPQQEPQKEQKRQSTLKGALMGFGIGLLLAVIAYFAGSMLQQTNDRTRISGFRQEVTAAQTGKDRLQEINSLLRAQTLLYRAAIDLEQRNYGSATDALREANQVLGSVDAGPAGVDAGQLQSLRQSLSGMDVSVQSDVGAERTRILDVAAQITRLVPPPQG